MAMDAKDLLTAILEECPYKIGVPVRINANVERLSEDIAVSNDNEIESVQQIDGVLYINTTLS